MVTEISLIGFSVFLYIRRKFRDMRKYWRNYRKFRRMLSENRLLKSENERLRQWKYDITIRLLELKQKEKEKQGPSAKYSSDEAVFDHA